MTQDQQVDAKRHYLPAAAIGYFAEDPSPARMRKRAVWVLRKDGASAYKTTAERVGLERHIYGYGKGWGMDHDDYFKSAEAFIHEPVDTLMQASGQEVDASAWVKLAWYITIQITRGVDLEHDIQRVVKENGWPHDRIAGGYPLTAQRISTAVLRARWQFACSRDRDFILGDRGITGMYYPDWQAVGYFMPLRPNFGVMLGPAPFKKQLKWVDGAWRIEVPFVELPAAATDKVNQVMWHASRSEAYGTSADQLAQVRQAAPSLAQPLADIAPRYENAQLLGLSAQERMKDELLLLSLLGGIKNPSEDGPFLLTV
jgi:hypothetical protein